MTPLPLPAKAARLLDELNAIPLDGQPAEVRALFLDARRVGDWLREAATGVPGQMAPNLRSEALLGLVELADVVARSIDGDDVGAERQWLALQVRVQAMHATISAVVERIAEAGQ